MLVGCSEAKINSSCYHNLPSMPIAGKGVAKELLEVCTQNKCPNINNWLNQLYLFRKKYEIYQDELRL